MIDAVFVDMDGVLVDFFSGAVSLFGHRPDVSIDVWPPGEWSIPTALQISEDDFWAAIDSTGGMFWRSLKPYDWAGQLLAAAWSAGTTRLLSSPSRDPNCWSEKKRYRDTHFHDVPLILCSEKEFVAAPRRLLIDDSDKHVEKWRKAGGEAILFPRPWNALHLQSRFPLAHVRHELSKLVEGAT